MIYLSAFVNIIFENLLASWSTILLEEVLMKISSTIMILSSIESWFECKCAYGLIRYLLINVILDVYKTSYLYSIFSRLLQFSFKNSNVLILHLRRSSIFLYLLTSSYKVLYSSCRLSVLLRLLAVAPLAPFLDVPLSPWMAVIMYNSWSSMHFNRQRSFSLECILLWVSLLEIYRQ